MFSGNVIGDTRGIIKIVIFIAVTSYKKQRKQTQQTNGAFE